MDETNHENIKILAWEDIQVDDFITIVRHKNRIDGSFKGDILKVLSKDHPYIMVDCIYPLRHPMGLDIRNYDLKHLNVQYVESVLESTLAKLETVLERQKESIMEWLFSNHSKLIAKSKF